MKNILNVFFLISIFFVGTVEAGKFGVAKKIITKFTKGSSKNVITSIRAQARGVSRQFNLDSNKLFVRLTDKKNTKNRDKAKKKDDNARKMLSIASWNLQNHTINGSKHKRDAINKYIKSLFYIQHTDIVFLQELRDNRGDSLFDAAHKLKLNTYGYLTYYSKSLGENRHKERYAILIHPLLLKKLKLSPIDIRLTQLRNYREFKRPPFGLRLGKKLILLNTHIVYSGDREKELKMIKQQLTKLTNRHKIKNVIVAGDFNLNNTEIKRVLLKSGGRYSNLYVTTNRNTTSKNSYDHVLTNLPVKNDLVSRLVTTDISDHSPIRVKISLLNKK